MRTVRDEGVPAGEGHADDLAIADLACEEHLPQGFGSADTIEALAGRRAQGQVTSTDLVKRSLARATALRQRGSSAFTRIWTEQATASAAWEDSLVAAGTLPPSLLAGLPIAIKDNCDARGDITQAGSPALSHAAPAVCDATCVARLRSAGAVIIGKTNMSEFAFANTGDNREFGMPRNPCDPDRLVGGSSSGAAASVADGSVVAALGTDTGGSIRGPAALCGLAGFKPSEGRVPGQGVTPLSTTFDTIGPIARSIESCAIIDAVLSDTPWRPLPELPLRGLSFGVPTNMVLDDLDPEVAADFNATLKYLSAAGATVLEFSWPEIEPGIWREAYPVISRSETYAVHGRLVEERLAEFDAEVARIILSGASVSPRDRNEALKLREAVVNASHDLMARFHAVLMPTVPILAPRISDLDNEDQAKRIEYLIGRNNEIANFFDCCGATVSCQAQDQLPVGLLVMARNGEDRRVLSMAKAIENGIREMRNL